MGHSALSLRRGGGGARIDDGLITTLEERVASLRTLDAQMGGARLFNHARSDLGLVTSVIKNAKYTGGLGARLHSLAAQVAYLTGWMAYDSGLHSAGQQYYVAALRAARTAGEHDLGAFLLAEMGVHASDGGYNDERASLLRVALDESKKLPQMTRAYLYLHLAAALAQQKEHRQAAGALRTSEALYERSGDSRGEWLMWFGESQINSTRGKVMLWAGKPGEATDYLAASVNSAVPRDKAVRAGRLAEAHLAGGNLDGALAAANYAVTVLELQVVSNRAVDRLSKFSSKLGTYAKEPAVRNFRERLKALPETIAA